MNIRSKIVFLVLILMCSYIASTSLESDVPKLLMTVPIGLFVGYSFTSRNEKPVYSLLFLLVFGFLPFVFLYKPDLPTSLLIKLSVIFIGARALQYFFLKYISKKKLPVDNTLHNSSEVLSFFWWFGVSISLIGSLLVVPALTYVGFLAKSEIVTNLFLSVGVEFLSTICLATVFKSFSAKNDFWARRRITYALPLAVAVFAYYNFSVLDKREREEPYKNAFEQHFKSIESLLNNKIFETRVSLKSIESLFKASKNVSKDEFRIFITNILDGNPLLSSVEWAPKLHSHEVLPFVDKLKRRGHKFSNTYGDILIKDVKNNLKEQKILKEKLTEELSESAKAWIEDELRELSSHEYYPVVYLTPPPNLKNNNIGYQITKRFSDISKLETATNNHEPIVADQKVMRGDEVRTPRYALYYPVHKRNKHIGYVVGLIDVSKVFSLSELRKDSYTVGIKSHIFESLDFQGLEKKNSALTLIESKIKSDDMFTKREVDFAGKKLLIVNHLPNPLKHMNSIKKKWFRFFVFFIGLTTLSFILLVYTGKETEISNLVATKTWGLINSKRRAEENARRKAEFLASMSHKIRTPMNAVIGLVEILSHTNLNNEQKNIINSINENGDTLLHTVNDVLDISRLESGSVELELRFINMAHLVESIKHSFKNRALKKGVELIVQVDADYPLLIEMDEYRIKQVIENLLGNALKFTKSGKVVVSISGGLIEASPTHQFDENDEPVFVEDVGSEIFETTIKVTDTGVGIPRHRINGLIGEHSKSDYSISRIAGGPGIGLSIVKKIVKLMQGKLTAESKVGEGSCFTVKIPHRYKLEGDQTQSMVNSLSNSEFEDLYSYLHVLVLEDNKTNQFVVKRFFSKLGLSMDLASDGAEGVQLARANKYDLIFMDLHMPNVDGFEATKQIQENSKNQATPIIALTADVFAQVSGKIESAGMIDYLPKPLKIVSLKKMIEKHAEPRKKEIRLAS